MFYVLHIESIFAFFATLNYMEMRKYRIKKSFAEPNPAEPGWAGRQKSHFIGLASNTQTKNCDARFDT